MDSETAAVVSRVAQWCGIGAFVGTMLGAPIALALWSLWVDWVSERVDRESRRRADIWLRQQKDRDRKAACRRCGHPKHIHAQEPEGCAARFVNPNSGELAPCECERFLKRSKA